VFFNPGLFKFTPMGSRTLGPEVLLRFLQPLGYRPTRSLEASYIVFSGKREIEMVNTKLETKMINMEV
jgi:hypothetical protein